MTHSRPPVIDAHLHLDHKVAGGARAAMAVLDDQLAEAGIERAIVLHLLIQRWPVEEVADALACFPRLSGLVNVDPFGLDPVADLRRGLSLGFVGLKLHPRLQSFDLDDPRVAALIREAGSLGVPTVIDAFPDGDWLMGRFDPAAFAHLARACPDSRIVAAHFAGHHCIDMMMMGKRCPNLWFDLSYSLLYYRGSSVVGDLAYCCKSMKFQRVLYGSDYPDRDVGTSLEASLDEFARFGIEGEALEALLSGNAKILYGWK